ncbi:MAG TPA: asparagine synthase (glutamine-hydrolyzing) [Polyangia bacterium]
MLERPAVASMCDALRRRGPDDEGGYAAGPVALGHRRLSIIDLGGGHQPLGNEDGSIQIVLNGEIYNFQDLRRELEVAGHVFRTRSDTEAVVHAYEQWGDQCVERLDGMFAFGLWDGRRQRLLCARDRFGKKPLFYARTRDRFIFASTLTALLRHPAAPRAVDTAALARYLVYDFVPAPATLVDGARKVQPAERLSVTRAGAVAADRYWDLAVGTGTPPRSEEELGEEIRARLQEATRRRLVADVPLGAFLSGGLDSSAVVCMMRAAGATRIQTFSIGFDDPSYDETAHAERVARLLGTEHRTLRLQPRAMLDIVPRLGEILDEPIADSSILPTYFLCQHARTQVTVALSGDGGDELFGGYPTYQAHRLAPLVAWLPNAALRAAARAGDALPVSSGYLSLDFKLRRTLLGLPYPADVRNYVWLGSVAPPDVARLLGPAARPAPVPDELLAEARALYHGCRARTHLDRVMYQDIRLYLGGEVLTKVDRAAMASSLEVRSPFLDTAVATLAAGLPWNLKLRGLTTKYILKQAFRGLLPPRNVSRRKQGFAAPVAGWLRRELRPLTDELFAPAALRQSGLLDPDAVAALLAEHRGGRRDHRKALFSLMVFELWRRAHGL